MIQLSLINPFRYAYSSARISALLSGLISRNQFKKILEISTFDETLDYLRQTNYNEVISKVNFGESFGFNFDKAIYSKISKDIQNIISFSPKKIKPLLRVFLEHEEYKILRSILKSIILEIDPDFATTRISPFGRLNSEIIRDLLNNNSITNVVNYFFDFPLRKKILAIDSNENKGSKILEIDSIVDNYEFEKKIILLKKLHGIDKLNISRLLSFEIDLQNIIFTLRAINLDLNIEKTRRFWILFSFRMGENSLISLYNCKKDSRNLFAIPSIYKELLDSIKKSENYLLELELKISRFLSNIYYLSFFGNRLHSGIIWSYLRLMLFETNDVRTIILGKKLDFTREDILNKLILFN